MFYLFGHSACRSLTASRSSPLPSGCGRGQFLADDLAIMIDDHRQLAVMMPEGKTVSALVIANLVSVC
jgi:hypothetical protein